MTTTPARAALMDAIDATWVLGVLGSTPEALIDAAIAEDRATRDAEVRAAALTEAADFMRDAHFRDGMSVQEIGTALRHTAADARPDCAVCHQPADGHPAVCFPPARPDDTTGAQRPVSLGTPCARCGHSRNWHENGRCTLTAPPNRCGCRHFTPDDTRGA